MSTKKRLLAICVSLLTIPAFTIGDAPYNVADITDQAYAISNFEHASSFNSKEMMKAGEMFDKKRIAETTTECGTEETEAETETTVTETSTTAAITSTEATIETTQTLTEAMVVEAKSEVEMVNQVDPTETVEPSTEAETFVEETMAETFYDEETTEESLTEEETSTEVTGRYEFVWDGKKLNPRDGIVKPCDTPTGLKETFYNLNMYGCLDLMGLSYDGYNPDGDEDGFKTYNGYIMVASPDLNRWPKGSYIETTNGMGIVVDFCPAGNLDIAVTW